MSAVMELLKIGSRETPEGESDPKRIRYRTAVLPEMDVVMMIKDAEILNANAISMERRLRKRVKRFSQAWDYSLEALSSYKGIMLDKVNTQTSRAEYTMFDRTPGKGRGLMNMMRQNQDAD